MATVALLFEEWERLIQIIAERHEITTPSQRLGFLEACGIEQLRTHLSLNTPPEEFARDLVRLCQGAGTWESTGKPALTSVLLYLLERFKGQEDKHAFIQSLLAKPFDGDVSKPYRPTLSSHIFTNIWYTPRRFEFWEIRDYDIGTLTLSGRGLSYVGERTPIFTLSSTHIQQVAHFRQPGSVNNNWAQVTYRDGSLEKVAYFAEASRLGIGELTGGSHALFIALKRLEPPQDLSPTS